MKTTITKPFVVQSNDVKTVALGTSFNVNSRNESSVEVVLVKGKVKVSKDDNDKYVLLSPGKSATVTDSGEYIVEDFNYMEKVGWKDRVLVFKDNSLSEVRTKLENWYGVKFIDFEDLDDSWGVHGNQYSYNQNVVSGADYSKKDERGTDSNNNVTWTNKGTAMSPKDGASISKRYSAVGTYTITLIATNTSTGSTDLELRTSIAQKTITVTE